jgi:DNA polymerase III subunit gamma/tau
VRDSLSLLDQAIAHSGSATGGRIVAEEVRSMLGLADRTRVVDLFEQVMRGDLAAALAEFKAQYDVGADPMAILSELAEFIHLVTRLKIIPDAARDPSLSEVEKTRGLDFAQSLSLKVLTRAWQLLTKGLVEIRDAGRPVSAAQMLLVRLADDALRVLRDAPPAGGSSSPGGGSGGSSGGGSAGRMMASGIGLAQRPVLASTNTMPQALSEQHVMAQPLAVLQPVIHINHFADLVTLAGQKRDLQIKAALERDVKLVSFEDGRISFAMAATASRSFPTELKTRLRAWTGRDWDVKATEQDGQPTLREQVQDQRQKRESDALSHPLVQAVLGTFPGARIVDVRGRGDEPAAPPTAGMADHAVPDADDGLAEWGEDHYIIDDM